MAPATGVDVSRRIGIALGLMLAAALAAPASAAESRPSATLKAIEARGHLVCGVNEGLLGFGLETTDGTWRGFDVDICRAVAAAALGDAEKVEFVPLGTGNRFEALAGGKIDMLSRNTTWTMQRDADFGLRFPAVALFDGQGFIARADRGLVSAQQFDGMTVCVLAGTTTETNLGYYFARVGAKVAVKSFPARAEMLGAYEAGQCDGYSADRTALFADRASFKAPRDHTILPETISKEPLGPVVRDGDPVFAGIVGWTVSGLINAEEVGLGRAAVKVPLTGDMKRLNDGADSSGARLGLKPGWLLRAVGAAGHYGELFEANLGAGGPLGMSRGMNALWNAGGILYAPPMW